MEVFDAVRTLLAVRSYQDRPIPEDVVRRVLEAGRLSPSANNRQPWHFVVVQERETLRQLAALLPSAPYVAQAPLAIVVVVARTRFAVSDASRAIQSMLLTAWSEGVGSNWDGFGPIDGVGALLGVPENLDVLAVLPLGYPADDVGEGKKQRKALGEIAHRERWDQSFT
jgi:nitroreductase